MIKIIKYWPAVAIIALVTGAVLFRTYSSSFFRYDAVAGAKSSVNDKNIIKEEDLSALTDKTTIIDLDPEALRFDKAKYDIVKIAPHTILEKRNLARLKKADRTIILYSSDLALSARIWMVLSQAGIDDLLILVTDPDTELLKHKIRPDTLSWPDSYQ